MSDLDDVQTVPCPACGAWPLEPSYEHVGDESELVHTCPHCGWSP
jgi:hypothetical protein